MLLNCFPLWALCPFSLVACKISLSLVFCGSSHCVYVIVFTYTALGVHVCPKDTHLSPILECVQVSW